MTTYFADRMQGLVSCNEDSKTKEDVESILKELFESYEDIVK